MQRSAASDQGLHCLLCHTVFALNIRTRCSGYTMLKQRPIVETTSIQR